MTNAEQFKLDDERRGRRFNICRGINQAEDAIAQIPMDAAIRQEIINQLNVTLRLALMHNDGQVSQHRVPAF